MADYTIPPIDNVPFKFTVVDGYTIPQFDEVPFKFGITPHSSADMQAAINVIQAGSMNLQGNICGIYYKQSSNLEAFIGTHLPANLSAVLIGIGMGIGDLSSLVFGERYKGYFDIGAVIQRVFLRGYAGLTAYIRAPFDVVSLPAYLNIVSTVDLPASIGMMQELYKDLESYLTVRYVKDLFASIHGFDTRNIQALVNGVYGPYDLQAYLRVHPYLNLPTNINGWYSNVWDIPAFIEGFYSKNLLAFVNTIPAQDLLAIISASGESVSLGAYIVPSVVRLKQAVLVSLLEHKDLKALINFQCVSSGYSDLGVTFGTIFKKLDLSAFIWSWKSSDKYGDLQVCINTGIYSVENKFYTRFVPEIDPYTRLRVKFGTSDKYVVFNTQPVLYGSYYTKVLSAYIYAMPLAVDLGALVEPVLQTNYTELPDYINPKSNVVVIKFNDKWQEEWRRFVEIMFRKDGPAPYHYFYVSGTSQVYKIDRNRHWTIWATSYDKDETTMFDRANVRTKFIFNMSNYTKMDEALRDLIDKVAAYKEINMPASIYGVGGRNLDLNAAITPCGTPRHRWAKYLGASITAI